MLIQDIIANKRRIFSRRSYLYHIAKLMDERKASGEMDEKPPSLRVLLKQAEILFIGEYRKTDPSGTCADQGKEIDEAAPQICMAADAFSIHTEEMYFNGHEKLIEIARPNCQKPIIKRDFVVSAMQLYHAKIVGASAVTLVTRILEIQDLKEYLSIAVGIDIDPIAEVSSAMDLEKALAAGFDMILLNSFDYDTMENNPSNVLKLTDRIPKNVFVFADCLTYDDEIMALMKKARINGVFLSGDLMCRNDIEEYIHHIKRRFGVER